MASYWLTLEPGGFPDHGSSNGWSFLQSAIVNVFRYSTLNTLWEGFGQYVSYEEAVQQEVPIRQHTISRERVDKRSL